jgi:maltose O-acetyltransferase
MIEARRRKSKRVNERRPAQARRADPSAWTIRPAAIPIRGRRRIVCRWHQVAPRCTLIRSRVLSSTNDHPAAGTPTPEVSMQTEKDKMLAGELYDALDPELVQARIRARDLCQDLNASRESDEALRRRILRELFGQGGDSVWMQPPFYCDYGSNILLGERVYFNFNCVVLDGCPVRIGDFTMFGPAVQIYTASHPLNADLRRRQEFGKPVEIGHDVWVGGGTIICPGVTIGPRAVIGAGSVVTKDIPAGTLAVGNPCRVIREITE